MEVYFDNSATTRVLPEVRAIMNEAMDLEYGNPSSLHQKGVNAEKYIAASKQTFAKLFKVKESEIVFTSGGTESNNLAIFGAARANRRAGRHLITTKIEHPCVKNPMKQLEEEGYEVTYLTTDTAGHISPEELADALREDTILVSIMYVNNEIGAVEPIGEAAKLIHEKSPHALFHVDAIQAFGKYRICPARMGIDLMSVSGHKFHGPKGTGVLYVGKDAKISPLILGGGQQNGMRSGTENVPGIAGIGVAAEAAYANFEEKRAHETALKDALIDAMEKLPDVQVNSLRGEAGAPHIVSVTFKGVRSEVLLHSLEDRGIYVSAGSACSSNKTGKASRKAASDTLKAIGLSDELAGSTLRFSFSRDNTMEEVRYCAKCTEELLPVLRRYTAR